jgi:hypothetical protein
VCDPFPPVLSVDNIASYMATHRLIPEERGQSLLPPVFVVNCQLPEGEPAMFNSPDDGPGWWRGDSVKIIVLMDRPIAYHWASLEYC